MAADAHVGYLATCNKAAREQLLAIPIAIEAAVSGTPRTMAYRMPSLRKGRVAAALADRMASEAYDTLGKGRCSASPVRIRCD